MEPVLSSHELPPLPSGSWLDIATLPPASTSDESWRHERVKRQAGGEDKLNFVGDVLWQTVDEIAVKHSDLEV